MLIPLKDLNPRRSFPIVNLLLIATNIAVFLYEVSLPERVQNAFVLANATVPSHVLSFLTGPTTFSAAFLPLLTSMFLHSGILHIAGNMLFLYIFGDNIEDYFGHLPYLFFYLACGVGAGLLHVAFNLHSHLPALGASGAISGVMGAYLILYPKSRVLTLIFIFLVPLPAIFVLGYWFVIQFLEGISSLGMAGAGGVAWWAHVGGFVLGMLFASAAGRRQLQRA
ncbi:MAG TPA: rhomboid family intramembrane serine protease [Candidatus Acidoferrales bacterium]|nr:rhomboid family intramembrane serine protease [Candidatus Acidoferrales bacterium]